MKKGVAEKYFKQKNWSFVEIIFIVIAIAASIVAMFVRGGGPLGIPILVIAIISLIISKSTKIKDIDIDTELDRLVTANIDVLDPKTSIKCFDLQTLPVVKGKDGILRSPNYIISVFAFEKDCTQITKHTIDLLLNKVQRETYTIQENEKVTLVEKTISVLGNKKSIQILHCECISMNIPISTNEIDAFNIVKKICDCDEKN